MGLRPDWCSSGGARLTLRGATGRDGQSTAAGDFAFLGLPAGDYEVSAESARIREGASCGATCRRANGPPCPSPCESPSRKRRSSRPQRRAERDVQEIPIAISAVSQADLGRLGTQTIEGAPALAPSVTFSQNTGLGPAHDPWDRTNAVFAGSDPEFGDLSRRRLPRPAGDGVPRFLDLDRIEVLRGPQGTLYGRNAVGGAMNLMPRPPTNDFEASARVTAGNFGELRADARISGPLKRDRVMGSVAFARGVRDGFVRDLEHPDHPLGGDDVTAARGQLRVVFDRRTSVLLSSDVDHQSGVPLTYNKVLVAKPGYQFDNPRTSTTFDRLYSPWNDTLHYGASARLTMALTPATTLVSLTAFRALDYEFFADSDSTELDLLRTRQLELQHQLSQEITISHQQPRLTWVGGVFLFSESDHQTIWAISRRHTFQRRLDPRVDADQPRRVRTGHGRTDVPALGDRRRSVHARGEGHRQCRRALCPR